MPQHGMSRLGSDHESMAQMKKCNTCKEWKTLDQYHKEEHRTDGLEGWCKTCKIAYDRDYRARNPGKQAVADRKASLKRKWGLSIDDYQMMFDVQDGVCAICGKPETAVQNGRVLRLAVDHDHACCRGRRSCGKCIRSLLCSNCNNGLGRFNDNSTSLRNAADYLDRYCAVPTDKLEPPEVSPLVREKEPPV